MRIYPINNSVDNLNETYDKDGNKILLLSSDSISKIFRNTIKGISKSNYKLFRIVNNGNSEIIIVKKNSEHLKILKKSAKNYF